MSYDGQAICAGDEKHGIFWSEFVSRDIGIAIPTDIYIGRDCYAYVPRYKLTPKDAVLLIASANGLPVIAHPIELPGLDELRNWLPDLCEAGMVGLETYYGPYTPENERELLTLAHEYDLIPTGGTDFHGPGIHPTPLGGRYVPFEAVEALKAEAAKRRGRTPP